MFSVLKSFASEAVKYNLHNFRNVYYCI